MRIGIDLMGGDSPPESLLKGVISAARHLPVHIGFSLFAPKSFQQELPLSKRYRLVPCEEVIHMEDDPLHAVRIKKKSSLVLAMRQHAEGKVDSVISCGNTGALLASSVMFLSTFQNFERPALLAEMPTPFGNVAVLDVGGNVHCTDTHLVQFAHLGAAYRKAMLHCERPRIALLNIGKEHTKGTQLHRTTYRILANSKAPHFDFCGNVEGGEVFYTNYDVIVCDGFAGNILLKTAEGLSRYLLKQVELTFRELNNRDAFVKLQNNFNNEEYPGAYLCGVKGTVVKCHGNATARSMEKSVLYTYELLKRNTTKTIASIF